MDVTPGSVGQTRGTPGRHIRQRGVGALVTYRSLHVVVVRILADIADIQNDGLGPEILPPVRGAEYLGPDIAGLVQNRLGAVAGIFDDFALLDIDQGRPVVVAVPWHDAARLDRQLAEAQFAVFEVCGLLLEIDRTQSHVGDADRLEVDLLAGVYFHLVGGTFAGKRGRRRRDRSGDDTGEREALPERAWIFGMLEHVGVSSVLPWPRMIWPAMRPTIVEITNSRKCRLALVSIARRYARDQLSTASQHVLDV